MRQELSAEHAKILYERMDTVLQCFPEGVAREGFYYFLSNLGEILRKGVATEAESTFMMDLVTELGRLLTRGGIEEFSELIEDIMYSSIRGKKTVLNVLSRFVRMPDGRAKHA